MHGNNLGLSTELTFDLVRSNTKVVGAARLNVQMDEKFVSLELVSFEGSCPFQRRRQYNFWTNTEGHSVAGPVGHCPPYGRRSCLSSIY
jgi:hypothetical protein